MPLIKLHNGRASDNTGGKHLGRMNNQVNWARGPLRKGITRLHLDRT